MAAMLKAPATESRGYTLLGTGKTVADWESFDESLCNVELIDGDLWMAPRPTARHQLIQADLASVLVAWISRHSLGRLMYPPVGLLLPSGDVFEPDLVFLEKAHEGNVPDWTKLTSPPALVIEIVSPSSRKRDWMVKRDGYAAMCVPNYWIVETNEATIWGFHLADGAYVEVPQPTPGHFEAPPFPGLKIPLAQVFGS